MKVLFWGTPDFAIPSLRALVGEGHEVVGVVTQPDRPAGRGRSLRASPVKEAALAEGIPVLTPERPRGEAFLDTLGALGPEISVVVAYGHILPLEVLHLPDRDSVNVHASLLPELRGAAPVNWAIVRGHERTGITIMRMTAGMDEGPTLLQRAIPIEADDTASALTARLSELGAEALVEALALLEIDALDETPQNDEAATYAPKVSREVARVDWTADAREVSNHIRGMDSVPGAWTTFRDDPVKLFVSEPKDRDSDEPPGTIVTADPERGLEVRAGRGLVSIREVQPAGKRRMSVDAWLRGGGPDPGDRFR